MEPDAAPARARLRRLLNPRHIAFVGGRSMEGAIRSCEALGYEGEIWAVNPRYSEIAGRPCYPSAEALPEAPDAAFVGVGRDLAPQAVGDLAAAGAGGCVCLAAGFSELGAEGAARQRELVAAAGQMPVVGPNCYGILNYLDGVALWPDLHGGARVPHGVALVSQSGNISLNATMADPSLPLSHVISVGNQAVLELADYIEALLDDPRVTAIGLYVEGIGDAAAFSRAALRALRQGVPLVALKVGASELAARIVRSHTGSLATPDSLHRALFERLGIMQVDSLPTLLETLKLVTAWGHAEPMSLGVLAASGGDAAMLADLASPRGLAFPSLEEARAEDLQAQLGDLVRVSNPLDYNTGLWGKRDELERCFATMMEGPFDAVLLTLDFPREGSGDPAPWEVAVDALIAARGLTGQRAAVISTLPELLPAAASERLMAAGIAPLRGLREGTSALGLLSWYAQRRRQLPSADDSRMLMPILLEPPPQTAPRTLDEWDGKRLLADRGLSVPDGRLVTAPEAPDVAAELGWPVIVKAVGEDLPHKTDVRAVSAPLHDIEEVRAATADMGARLAERDQRCFLVERVAGGAVAELLVGVVRDERFGFALMLGAGGRMVSLHDDRRILLLPTDADEIRRALDSLRVASLLRGYRGAPAGDREAVIDAAVTVSTFAREHPGHVLEVDVNPLLVLPEGQGVMAVDVLVRLGDEHAHPAVSTRAHPGDGRSVT